jgi:chitin disaccharide deacetylase
VTQGVECGAPAQSNSVLTVPTIAERLGHRVDARLLIITCDDLGSSHAANVGTFEALRDGAGTSASLMVPGPWAREATARYRGEDLGVQLTLNSEWDLLRWGPTTQSPSLLDGDGGFPRTVQELWDHADVDEVRRECRTQIERAILWGFDVSHLDSHLDALPQRPEFFDVYLELAADFGLPIRLPDPSAERTIGFPVRRLAAEAGVLVPDFVVRANGGARRAFERTLADLSPGVTELCARPAADTPELRAVAPDWVERVDDHQFLMADVHLQRLAQRAGATLIGYRELRDLQRSRG